MKKKFIENVDKILLFLNEKRIKEYNSKHIHLTKEDLLKKCFGKNITIEQNDAYVFCRKEYIDLTPMDDFKYCNKLSADGIVLLNKFGSYSNYLKQTESLSEILAKKQLADYPKIKWYMRWGFRIGAVGVLLTLISILQPKSMVVKNYIFNFQFSIVHHHSLQSIPLRS